MHVIEYFAKSLKSFEMALSSRACVMPVTHIPAIGADKQFPAHLTCNMQFGTEFFRYLFCHWHKTLLVFFVTTSLSRTFSEIFSVK